MNAEHPNAVAYRKAADAFRARDLRAIEALVDEDVVWHVPGHHPRAGEIRGRDALLAWLADLAEDGLARIRRWPGLIRLSGDANRCPSELGRWGC
jgi:ketosteroid isomerase-like protein